MSSEVLQEICKEKHPVVSGRILFSPLPHSLGGRRLGLGARVNFILGSTIFIQVKLGKSKCQRRLEVEEKQQYKMWCSQMREKWERQSLLSFILRMT